ncbi:MULTISPECIES: ABC1 kinase family protein [Shouchella]|uniref:AarF/ABC1/UbiB kinase family protein n=2 Tax=Shouchella TaxID=2893057 RepID=A0ABY7W3U2_9BACI|nr:MULTISPECIES: AarF/ABC1/UbiB kinase family protein [Shouchella]MED4127136.1 AarF/ABC1/UbiB kinase family protein [Shouchella miscanthi]WDF03620.1 AarF/ABC1/UbiB kinase family protein [Shouchella hunanensis]
MLKKRMRYLSRYQDIITALYHYGFGQIVRDMGLLERRKPKRSKKKKDTDLSVAKRIRLLLEELGPTFIKLGQLASTRADLFPQHVLNELEALQDNVPSFPYEEAKEILEQELDTPIEQLFRSFNKEPLAAASIGQVHEAELPTGESVVVKIRRPHIQRIIETDLAILEDLLLLAEERVTWVKKFRLIDLFHEFASALKEEINYKNEAQNAERLKRQSKNQPNMYFPVIYSAYSSMKVLTMSKVEGTKITEATYEKGYDQELVAERFATGMFEQIFAHGFFHGDPHPGNIFVTKNNDIILIDFGMVGRLSDEMRHSLALLVQGLKSRHTDRVMKALFAMDIVHEGVDQARLHDDLDYLRLKYYDVPMAEISIGEAVQDLFTVANQHDCLIPPDLTMLGKALLAVESIVSHIAPSIAIIDIVEPFGRMLIKERYDPRRFARKMQKESQDSLETIRLLPKDLSQTLKEIRDGKLKVSISIGEIKDLIKKVDRISNKLAFSVVLLSFSIIMTGVIIGGSLTAEPTILLQIPAIEVGLTITSLMFLWIIWAIFRSGRF